MITLSIDEKDPHVLRVSASYLLALAGDITTTITDDKGRRVDIETSVAVDAGGPVTLSDIKMYAAIAGLPMREAQHDLENGGSLHADESGHAYVILPSGMRIDAERPQAFNAAELAEAKLLDGVPHVDDASRPPSAAEVFARPQTIASDAPSTVDAAPLPIAPADTTAITSIPTPPAVDVPPVPTPENVAAPAVAQTPAPAPGVELDTRGFPWDARIHSRTKSKKANGEWKYARGVEATQIAFVEAELKALMAIPTPVHSPAHTMTQPETVIAAPVVVPPPPPLQPAGTVSDPSAQTGNTVDTPPASIVPIVSPSSDFPSLMKRVTQAIAAGKLSESQVLAACTAHQVQAIPGLIQRPDLIPLVSEEIEKRITEAGGL
jgi:hypothetical protein